MLVWAINSGRETTQILESHGSAKWFRLTQKTTKMFSTIYIADALASEFTRASLSRSKNVEVLGALKSASHLGR